MKYIAVFHTWFVHSRGWEIKELRAKTEKDANAEASAIAYQKNYSHEDTAFTLVKIMDTEIIKQTFEKITKLSFTERLLGKILFRRKI